MSNVNVNVEERGRERSIVNMRDVNGDLFTGSAEGEVLVESAPNLYLFPFGMPVANNPLERVNITPEMADLFVSINARHIVASTVGLDRPVTEREAVLLAFHRLLVVKVGLVSPLFVPENYFVNYNEARQLSEADMQNVMRLSSVTVSDVLTESVQQTVCKTITDKISLLAFVFRARGHHYMPAYQELYDRVWDKCRYKPDQVLVSFQLLVTIGFHAIFPVILDRFWMAEVDAFHVNGALAKRKDCAVAGAAGPIVLRQGVEDLLMIAPGLRKRLEEAMLYLNEVLGRLNDHRFAGSVNARYYGTHKISFDEKRLGSIAATILAALDSLASDAPLGKSPALRRIGDNAPITGAVLGKTVGQIANRPEVADSLLIMPP